jgi:ribonuclease Z
MKPVYHPSLVNDPFGDPAVYVDFLFDRRAMLFDLGDLRALPVRKILRLTDVFVSHAHMDHFFGFDWLLRLSLGRELRIRLHGPRGFLDQVEHKLAAYTWNLVGLYTTDLTLEVTEILDESRGHRAAFRCRTAFRREGDHGVDLTGGIVLDEPELRVRFALLDHGTPCLAYALQEKLHVNVWKNRLDELHLEPGPWVRVLKRAMLDGAAPSTVIRATERHQGRLRERGYRLGDLAPRIAHASTGQKVAYVTDAAYHTSNASRILALAEGADQLFIEAVFGDALRERAAQKRHLTARQAGTLAREAGAKFATPFHFSPIYKDRGEELWSEFTRAFHANALSRTPVGSRPIGTG